MSSNQLFKNKTLTDYGLVRYFIDMYVVTGLIIWLDVCVCIGIVTANQLKSQNGSLFLHVWRRGRLALDPL